jgi:hypothetical protein
MASHCRRRGEEEGQWKLSSTAQLHMRCPAPIIASRALDMWGASPTRNNDDGLVPIVIQQPVLYLASASLDNARNSESTVCALHG